MDCQVNMKVVEDFGTVEASCTHYYAREWLAVRLAYGEVSLDYCIHQTQAINSM